MTFCTIENKRFFLNKNRNELNSEIYTTQGCLNATRICNPERITHHKETGGSPLLAVLPLEEKHVHRSCCCGCRLVYRLVPLLSAQKKSKFFSSSNNNHHQHRTYHYLVYFFARNVDVCVHCTSFASHSSKCLFFSYISSDGGASDVCV